MQKNICSEGVAHKITCLQNVRFKDLLKRSKRALVIFDRGRCQTVGFNRRPMQKHLQCNGGGVTKISPSFMYQTAPSSAK